MTQNKNANRRTRTDTTAGQTELMQDALLGDIAPPEHVLLEPGDMPYWNSIVRARARVLWNDSDLETAANLARCRADIERISRELRTQGDTLKNDRGTVVMNPKHALLETLTRRGLALARALQVHAEATVGKSREAKKVNTAAEDAKGRAAVVNSPRGHDLIPRRAH